MEDRSDHAYLWTRPNVSEIPYHVKLTNPTEDSRWADEEWGKCQCTQKRWEAHSSKMTFPKQAVSLTGITPFLGRVPLKRLFTRQQRDPEDPCCSLTKVKIVTQGYGSLFYLIQGVNVFDWTFQDDVRFTFKTACVVPGKVVPLHEALKMQKLKTVPPELAVIRITQFFRVTACSEASRGQSGASRLVRKACLAILITSTATKRVRRRTGQFTRSCARSIRHASAGTTIYIPHFIYLYITR